MPRYSPFCRHFRTAVKRSGLSLREISRRSEVSLSGVQAIFQGHRDPSSRLAEKLAGAVGMQIQWDVKIGKP